MEQIKPIVDFFQMTDSLDVNVEIQNEISFPALTENRITHFFSPEDIQRRYRKDIFSLEECLAKKETAEIKWILQPNLYAKKEAEDAKTFGAEREYYNHCGR